MTQTTFPITGEPLSNAQWGDVASEFAPPGVVASPGGAGMLPFRTGAGLFVPAGEALTTQGALYKNTADVQVTVTSNGGGSPRNDLLVLRHDFAVAPEARLFNIVGGAVGPTHTVATDVPLGRPVVPAGSVIPSSVTDARTFASAPVIPCRTVADIPAAVRKFGMVAVELASSPAGRIQMWNGAVWDRVVAASEYVGQRFYTTKRLPAGSFDQYSSAGSFVSLMAGTQAFRAGDWVMHVEVTLAAVGVATTVGNLRVMWSGVNLSGDARCDLVSTSQHYSYRFFFTTADLPGSTAWSVSHQTDIGDGLILNTGSHVTFEYLGPRS